MSNILQAIKNLIENPIVEVRDFYTGKNRANSVGEALEIKENKTPIINWQTVSNTFQNALVEV